jgi:Flp pilus assembly protein TadG
MPVDRKRELVFLIKNRRGNAVVETALVLPILLLLVFGITEFGRAWMTVNVMYTASREGCRIAVVTGPDDTLVNARVNQVMSAANLTPTSITRNGPSGLDPVERKVTVTVTSDFVVIPGKVLNMFEPVIHLSASTTMRHESF